MCPLTGGPSRDSLSIIKNKNKNGGPGQPANRRRHIVSINKKQKNTLRPACSLQHTGTAETTAGALALTATAESYIHCRSQFHTLFFATLPSASLAAAPAQLGGSEAGPPAPPMVVHVTVVTAGASS